MKMIVCQTCGHTSPENKKCYQFQVDDVAKIDLNRIVREQYEAGNLVTLITDGKEPKGLLVHNQFLEHFREADKVKLAGFILSPKTGTNRVSCSYENKTFKIIEIIEKRRTLLEDARYLYLTVRDLEKVPAELAAARAFTRKIKVVVHSL